MCGGEGRILWVCLEDPQKTPLKDTECTEKHSKFKEQRELIIPSLLVLRIFFILPIHSLPKIDSQSEGEYQQRCRKSRNSQSGFENLNSGSLGSTRQYKYKYFSDNGSLFSKYFLAPGLIWLVLAKR